MGRLLVHAICSLDGYVADPDGDFSWAEPDDAVLAHVNEVEADVGTYLYGRRTFELMTGWEDDPAYAQAPGLLGEFAAMWQAADKVVYSSTLPQTSTARTRLERRFDPGAVRQLLDGTERDVTVSGPTLAAHAFAAGLVDEVALWVLPVSIGAGTPALPPQRVDLALVAHERVGDQAVLLRYRVRR